MNTALKMKLEEMNRRLNEALDTDLFEESESEFNEFQAEVDSFERVGGDIGVQAGSSAAFWTEEDWCHPEENPAGEEWV